MTHQELASHIPIAFALSAIVMALWFISDNAFEWLRDKWIDRQKSQKPKKRDYTIHRAIGVVWGIPETTKPIIGLPDGKARLRFRANRIGEVFVKTSDGVRRYRIGIDIHPPATLKTGEWYAMEIGRNIANWEI